MALKRKKATESVRKLEDEMADVFFTLICLANSKNIDLDKAFKKMMKKYRRRDNDRFKRKIR